MNEILNIQNQYGSLKNPMIAIIFAKYFCFQLIQMAQFSFKFDLFQFFWIQIQYGLVKNPMIAIIFAQ